MPGVTVVIESEGIPAQTGRGGLGNVEDGSYRHGCIRSIAALFEDC